MQHIFLLSIFCLFFSPLHSQNTANDWQTRIDSALANGDKNLAAQISYAYASSLQTTIVNREKAIFALTSAAEWSEQTADNFLNGKIYYRLAFFYDKQNKVEVALEVIKKSQKMFDAVRDSISFADALLLEAQIHERAQMRKLAILTYTKLFDRYERNGNFSAQKKITEKLIELYQLEGNRAFAALYQHYLKNVNNPYEHKIFFDSSLVVALINENEQIESNYQLRLMLIVVTAIVLLVLIFYLMGKNLKAANQKLYRKNTVIRKQQKKTEELMLGILPHQVATELKEKGFATPRHYESVTIMFTDFMGFTNYSERVSPEQLVSELNYCFSEFDKITEKYGIEKIKTIGDAYMCAGGIPTPNESHAKDVVRAGLEMQVFMEEWGKKRMEAGEEKLELRIGINTGAVVAGVVGTSKFAYDIWGDAVNLAARVEAGSEVGFVNISASTFKLIENDFECLYRGKIKAKNKGEVDMYYIVRELPKSEKNN